MKNEDQCNYSIDYDPESDNKFSLYNDSNRDTLLVVPVTMKVGNKKVNLIFQPYMTMG